MKFKKILAGVLASAIALTAGIVPVVPVAAETNSEEMSYGDFKYKKVDEDDDGAYDYVEITDQNTTGTILNIPDKIDNLPVEKIDGNVFKFRIDIEAINVSENNAMYSSIDGILFNKDKTELISFPPKNESTEYEIPDSVTRIGECAFSGCSNLTSIIIPDSVTSIGDLAFGGTEIEYCKIKSITIPDSVTEMGRGVFSGCMDLKSVKLPKNIKSLDTYYPDNSGLGLGFFMNCGSLESIDIPKSVTSIGELAFCNCVSLTSITIPDSVTDIGSGVFYGCGKLTEVNLSNNIKSLDMSISWGVRMGFFQECTRLKSITIPDSVTSMGNIS